MRRYLENGTRYDRSFYQDWIQDSVVQDQDQDQSQGQIKHETAIAILFSVAAAWRNKDV